MPGLCEYLKLTVMFLTLGVSVSLSQIDSGVLVGPPAPETAADNEDTRQVRIYRETLLQGVGETIRVDAAMGLLMRKDQVSREILLDALAAKENVLARMSVCRALITGRSLGTTIGSLDAFLMPLLDVLKSTDVVLARLGAEALLIFRYDQIAVPLAELGLSVSADKQTRLNVIYAFQLRPDPESLKSLVRFLNGQDVEVVRAAEIALQESFGVPVGTNRQVWEKIIKEMSEKDPSELQRERLLRQELRLREIQVDRERWQKLYLASLDKEFEQIDLTLKSAYLLEKLGSDMPALRIWALDKAQRFPVDILTPLRDKLLSLLSDDSRQVRLATAKVLSTMSALNPAEKLMGRYGEETDPQVALAIFEALGEACFFAFSPGSKITLPVEIKTSALQMAVTYVSKDDPEMAKKGAEVLRKLLELEGLTTKESERYLRTILDRYTLETERKGAIRGELLTIMARLCGQSTQKLTASKMYRDLFVSVLRTRDENSLVRQAASMGIVNIDKTEALKLFRELSLNTDASPSVRQVMIELASQNGGLEDMEWLVAQIGSAGQTEPAWLAMLSILQRQDAKVISDWSLRLEQNPTLTEPLREVLQLAEQKAIAQKDLVLLCGLQLRLLKWYQLRSNYEQVAVYREKLEDKEATAGESVKAALRQTDAFSVEAYLQLRNYAKVFSVISDLMRLNLISEKSDIMDLIDTYIASDKVSSTDKKSLIQKLSELTIGPDQTWWQTKLEQWKMLLVVKNENSNGGDPNLVSRK